MNQLIPQQESLFSLRQIIAFLTGGTFGAILSQFIKRFAFEGFSVSEFTHVSLTVDGSNKSIPTIITAGLHLKIANGLKDSLIIEEIRTKRVRIEGMIFEPIRCDLQAYSETAAEFNLPPKGTSKNPLRQLPFLIKSDNQAILIIGCVFQYPKGSLQNPHEVLLRHTVNNPITLSFRLNGKWRQYRLKPKDESLH